MTRVRLASLFISLALILAGGAQNVFAAPSASPSPSPTVSASPAPDTDAAQPEQKATFPAPHAKAALLYDLNGGRVIFENNADTQVFPASTTKIMTALLALEKGNLSDIVTVSDSALSDITYLHSKLDLKSGEQLSLEQLLTALLVCSANDAANVIAEHISGDIPTFVALMNSRAKELGMTNTNFVNPHGFHDDNHYTTAHDLMLVTREALKNTTFCELVKIKTTKIPATNISKERMISSTNHLISRYRNTFHYYPYATGVKTGSTEEAGNCLVSTAQKNGVSLLSIVMGCDNENQDELAYSFVDSKAMFEYIFNNYKNVTIATTTDIISDSKVYEAKDNTRVALSSSKDVSMLLPTDYTAEEIGKQISLPERIDAPVEQGSQLGSVTYTFRGETIATVDLLAANEVKRDHFLHFLHILARIIFSPYVIIPVIIIIALLIFNAISRNKRKKIRRRKMKSQHLGNGYSQRGNTARRTTTTNRTTRPTSGRRPSQTSSTRRQSSRPTTARGSSRGSYRTGQRPTRPQNPDPWDKYR